MKVTAFSGSARKDGNTAILANYVLGELEKEGIHTELVQLAGTQIRGCTACLKCTKKLDKQCHGPKDAAQECIEKIKESDGIILASPVYFTDVSAEMKALIDRAGMVGKFNGDIYKRKLGAAVLALRRDGAIHSFDTINHFFLINQMIVPGANYWNSGFGRDIGDVEKDEEGVETMKILGKNMAWLLKKLDG